MNKKLDPGLRSKLRSARSLIKDEAAPPDNPADERIGIIVEFTAAKPRASTTDIYSN
jgi:hypothetical protein